MCFTRKAHFVKGILNMCGTNVSKTKGFQGACIYRSTSGIPIMHLESISNRSFETVDRPPLPTSDRPKRTAAEDPKTRTLVDNTLYNSPETYEIQPYGIGE